MGHHKCQEGTKKASKTSALSSYIGGGLIASSWGLHEHNTAYTHVTHD